jgi:hypothetical protein
MKSFYLKKERIKLIFISSFLFISYFSASQVQEVTIEDLQMEYYEQDSSAGAVILYNICNVDLDMVHNDFVLKYTHRLRLKFFDESQFDWADVKIPYYYKKMGEKENVKIKKAITYNLVNGKIESTKLSKNDFIEEQTSDYYKQIKFAFANVKPGSIIEYEYEIVSPFKKVRRWYFQYEIPVMYSEHNAELASFWQYNTLLQGYETPVIDTAYIKKAVGTCSFTNRQNKLIEYSYHKAIYKIAFENIPALEYEEYMKCKEDYVSKIDFQLVKYDIPGFVEETILKAWEEVAEGYYDFFELDKKINIPVELEGKLTKTSLTPEEKTKIILAFVQDEYTWNGENSRIHSQSSKELMETKTGNSADLNLHLIRLLRQNDVNAYPLLISTTSNGKVHYPSPFIKQFNYVLPLVSDNKGVFFCDATLKCAPYNLIPEKCLNGHGFLVDKTQSQFIELLDISQTSSSYVTSCSFNSAMDSVTMDINLRAYGYDALDLREYLIDNDKEGVTKKLFPMEENVQFNYSGKIEEEDYNKPLVLNFRITKGLLVRNNKIYFNPFICDKITENPFKSIQRKYPIDFRYTYNKKNLVTISVPQGYILESAPETKRIAITNNLVHYNFVSQGHGNFAQALAEYKVENAEIDAAIYPELQKLYNEMIKDQDEYFVISKQK